MTFDPEQFANTEYSESTSTEYIPLPEGEYPAVIDDVKFKTVDRKDGSGTATIMEVHYKLDVPESVLKEVGLNSAPKPRQDIWLDFMEGGGLDFGKGRNVKLGRLREAVGLNVPGQTFNFNMLKGRPVRVKTKTRLTDRGPFVDIADVTKLA